MITFGAFVVISKAYMCICFFICSFVDDNYEDIYLTITHRWESSNGANKPSSCLPAISFTKTHLGDPLSCPKVHEHDPYIHIRKGKTSVSHMARSSKRETETFSNGVAARSKKRPKMAVFWTLGGPGGKWLFYQMSHWCPRTAWYQKNFLKKKVKNKTLNRDWSLAKIREFSSFSAKIFPDSGKIWNHFSDFFVKTTSFFCFDNYNQVFADIAKKEISEKIRKLNFKLESNFVENDDIFHSCWWSSSTMLTFQLATVATKSVWLPWKFFVIIYMGRRKL